MIVKASIAGTPIAFTAEGAVIDVVVQTHERTRSGNAPKKHNSPN